jgi:hypothetical protein
MALIAECDEPDLDHGRPPPATIGAFAARGTPGELSKDKGRTLKALTTGADVPLREPQEWDREFRVRRTPHPGVESALAVVGWKAEVLHTQLTL